MVHVCRPSALLSSVQEFAIYSAYHLADECPCADGRVERLDFVSSVRQLCGVRESVCQAEIGLEYVVDSADDESHNGKRRVVGTHLFPKLGIILFEEVFVKVNYLVFCGNSCIAFIVFVDKFFHSRNTEYVAKLIDDVSKPPVEVDARYVIKEA